MKLRYVLALGVVALAVTGLGSPAFATAPPTPTRAYASPGPVGNSVMLSWDTPGANPAITSSEILIYQNGDPRGPVTVDGDVKYKLIPGPMLPGPSDYQFAVRSINADGASQYSALSNVVHLGPDARIPDTPTQVSAQTGPVGNSVFVSWRVVSNGGSPVTSSKVRIYQDGAALGSDFAVSGSSTSVIVPGAFLSDGHEYRFRVQATNAVGNSDFSALSNAVHPGPAYVNVQSLAMNEGNRAKPVNLTFTLSKSSTTPVTVAWKTADGTAIGGSDYKVGTGSVTFAAGETTKTVTVTVKGDRRKETDEQFSVIATTSGITKSGTITLRNDDKR
jgi:hypothetical protein